MGRFMFGSVLAIALRAADGGPAMAPTPDPTPDIIFGPEFFLGQIVCPVLSALVNETDLVPDEFGFVTRQQVFNAFRRIGISLEAATDTTTGNFGHLPDPQMINIFDMNLPRPTRPSPTGNLEHDNSTGIRDAFVPQADIFKIFEQFIGPDLIWSVEDIREAIAFFALNPNDAGTGPGTLETIELMFVEFALGEDSFLTQFEMRQLFLNHTYPAAFRVRRDLLVDLFDKGALFGPDEKLQLPWTFLGCFEETPGRIFRHRVPGPDHVNECATLCRGLGSSFFSLRDLDDCFCTSPQLGLGIPNLGVGSAPNSECDSEPCLVFNGCGGRDRTSSYQLGSAASEGLAREFPLLPDLPPVFLKGVPRFGQASINATGPASISTFGQASINTTDVVSLDGAQVGRAMSSGRAVSGVLVFAMALKFVHM